MMDFFDENEEQALIEFLNATKKGTELSEAELRESERATARQMQKNRVEYNARMAQAKAVASQLYLTV